MIATTRLKRLQKEVKNDYCNPGQHGNFGKEPWNIFPEDVADRTEQFIVNKYAANYGLPMSAAPRGVHKRGCSRGPKVFANIM